MSWGGGLFVFFFQSLCYECGSWITLHVQRPALINWLKIALLLNAMASVCRMQRAARDVSSILVTGDNRRSPAVITLIYCFIAHWSLLAVDGLQLGACAPLMQIKNGGGGRNTTFRFLN